MGVAVAAGMAVSNVALVRHEGFSPKNVLGIGIALALAAGEALAFYLYSRDVSGSEWDMRLRDTLCETALSAAEKQARADMPVRVPLYGREAGEFLSDRSGSAAPLAEMLARQSFEGGVDFFRVLNLELRRMRRTGATVIVTAQLNADIVEGVKHIRRMGPSARFYYITHTPDAPEDRPYIAQLQQNMVEVCYVTPA